MKIFEVKIPEEFNLKIFPVKINNNDIITSSNMDIRSQYSLEIYLHDIILKSNFLTNNIEDADILYIPIYTFLLAWKSREYFYDVNNINTCMSKIKIIIDKFELIG